MIGINPRGMTMREWCDQMTPVLATSGVVPQLVFEDWKAWARTVVNLPKISSRQPPNPTHFQDWRAWAIRFNEAIS
jgi:hypothetical protein